MSLHLSAHALQAGYRLETFERVDSTNNLAAAFARSGDPGQLWVVADEQVAAKARRGRSWLCAPGNLYATLLLVESFEAGQAATLGFVAGVSLMDAFAQLVPAALLASRKVMLKWPNDVLADGAKLTGILLELIPLQNGNKALLVGIGVNVAAAPAGLPYPATSLRNIGADCSAHQLLTALADTWIDNYRLWDHGNGVVAIRNKWLQHAGNIGQPVRIVIDNTTISGIFVTIDHQCRFILRKDDGEEIAIPAGDVHFGTVASARL